MSNRFLSFGRRRTTLVLFLLELFFYFSVTCSFLIEQRIHHYYRPNSAIQQKMSLTTTLSSTSHRIGFIGCGTIASAIVTGFATIEDKKEKDSNINDDDEGGGQPPPPLVKSIAISRRSRSKSEALKEKFPTLVTVYDENQEILDHADIIFITVLPQQASDVLQSLQFDSERHHLVSLVVCPYIVSVCVSHLGKKPTRMFPVSPEIWRFFSLSLFVILSLLFFFLLSQHRN